MRTAVVFEVPQCRGGREERGEEKEKKKKMEKLREMNRNTITRNDKEKKRRNGKKTKNTKKRKMKRSAKMKKKKHRKCRGGGSRGERGAANHFLPVFAQNSWRSREKRCPPSRNGPAVLWNALAFVVAVKTVPVCLDLSGCVSCRLLPLSPALLAAKSM